MPTYDIDEKILDFIYVIAMRDATLQGAFSASNKKDLWKDKVKSAPIRKELFSLIKKILDGLFKTQPAYDNEFMKTALNIKNEIKKQYGLDFNFGNCQKLINMTVKYVYIATYRKSTLKVKFKYCHCPMDSVMLDSVWRTRKNLEIERGDFLKSWGKESFNVKNNLKLPKRYAAFQDQIRKLCNCAVSTTGSNRCCYPIEYDYIIW